MDFGGIMPALDSGFGCPAATALSFCAGRRKFTHDLRSGSPLATPQSTYRHVITKKTIRKNATVTTDSQSQVLIPHHEM
jgi:hypothetical protein